MHPFEKHVECHVKNCLHLLVRPSTKVFLMDCLPLNFLDFLTLPVGFFASQGARKERQYWARTDLSSEKENGNLIPSASKFTSHHSSDL